ncbi:MAG: MBG domain-containing protein, partial [Pusillimonas sp.]
MNHIYRLIWNHTIHAWVVVSEIARSRGKRTSGVVLAVGLISTPAFAFGSNALPSGGSAIRGQASISQSGSHLQVSQASKNAVLNWNNFSIGKGASVHFDNANGATLNRVTGNLPSSIDGRLSATGSLYLVNRNGVIVGSQGTINAAGFMATTLDVRDDEFMAGGGLRFFGDSRAGILNLGSIHAASGDVSLVAHTVRNDGTITTPNGSVDLLAGQEVFLASPDSPALLVSVGGSSASAVDTAVTNTGLIEAAQARLEAADGNLYNLAINQSGVIRATGVSERNGHIVLTADGGTVVQDGKLSARNVGGAGGTILVGGDYQGKNPAVANATKTVVTANASMDASTTAAKGDGGRIIVWADQDTSFAGGIAARGGAQGGDGGFVEVSGKHTLDFRPSQVIDLSAKAGKPGTVLLDPDEMTVVNTVTGANQIATATVESGLASANYLISTSNFNPESGSGDITISNDLSWATANTLRLESGNAINIEANITASNGALELYAAREAEAPGESGLPNIYGGATLAEGKIIEVDRLRYGVNANSQPQGDYSVKPEARTEPFWIEGNLRVNILEQDLSNGSAGLSTYGDNNAIGAFRTLGNGPMDWVEIVNHSGDLSLYLNSPDADGLQIVTPGDLTMEAGSQLTSTWGSFVLASTNGNFTNQAGSNALSLSGNASFLIYTGSQAGTRKGGLAGTDEFSRTLAGNPPYDYSDNTSRFLFRDAFSPIVQELTYRADDLSRFYGSANPGLRYTVGGLQNGDLLANVVTGAPLLYTAATLQSGVGQYAINISQGTLASSSYSFLFMPGTLTVNPAPVNVDIANLNRFYGDLNPAFSATATGLKNSDTLAAAMAGWSFATSATRASSVGDYVITATRNASDANPNYSLTFAPGTLHINPTPITLTLGPTAMVYGGALPDFRTFATLAGTYNGDTLATAFPSASFGTLATSASSVGSYAVNAISGFSNPNYLLTLGSLGAFNITKAPLVINANNASRVYGDANPVFTVASVTGWKNGDTLASILPGLEFVSSATANSNVGAYAIVPAGSASNYEFVAGSGLLAINKAPIDVFLNAATRYYGDADPQFSATYQGLKNGETALPGLNLYSATSAKTPVGNYLILLGGSGTFQNYAPTFHGGLLTIAPRPLTVAGNNAARTYGEGNPALSVAVSNAMSWDTAQAAAYWMARTQADQRSDAGSYAITPVLNPYGNPFDNLSNYAVNYQPGTLSVLRAPLAVVAQPISTIWGDGRPPLAYSVSGFMPWDSADTVGRVLLTSQAGGTSVAPGRYAITVADANVGNNYRAELLGSPMVRVLPRPIVIVGNYAAPLPQIQQINPGQIDPFTVKRYDGNGNELSYQATAPLAGGPQFSVLASSDGTRGDGFATYVGMPFIQPAAGTSLAEVLRYYDVVSKPGIAQATTLTMENDNIINRNWMPPVPAHIVIDQPDTKLNVQIQERLAPSEAPSLGFLVGDAFPDNRVFADELQALLALAGGSGPDADAAKKLVDAMPREFMAYLNEAMKNENAYNWYRQTIADTEAWIADLSSTRPRPANHDALVASAQADLANWRAEMDAMPSLDALRQKLAAGDATTVQALMPVITAKLVRDQKNGALSPQTQDALVRLINEQRAHTIAAADAKY